MEVGPYESVASALQTAKNAFKLQAEKARGYAELAQPAREAEEQARKDTARNVVLAVDVAQQQRDVAEIIANMVSDSDDTTPVSSGSVDVAGLAQDAYQAQRRQEVIGLYQQLDAEGRGPASRIGSRVSILA